MELELGTMVRRKKEAGFGSGTIGEIVEYSKSGKCYWVKILEGKNGMEGWRHDAWSKNWTTPIKQPHTWEV